MSLRPAIALALAAFATAATVRAQNPAPVQCQVSWESDARPLDLNNAIDRVHVRDDLARVGLIVVRWASRQPADRRPRLVPQCTDHLIAGIAARHHVGVPALKALRDDLPLQYVRRP